MAAVAIESVGRRHYLTGNTYPVRDRIRALGAHWDGARKAWWTGKRDEAERLVAKLNEQAASAQVRERSDGISITDRVIRGRAEYKGKTYYLLAHGAKDGRRYAKLCSRDGSLVFWAGQEHIGTLRVLKKYDEPRSIQSLRDYAERRKRERETDECHCRCHREPGAGRPGTTLYDGCDRCGCEACC